VNSIGNVSKFLKYVQKRLIKFCLKYCYQKQNQFNILSTKNIKIGFKRLGTFTQQKLFGNFHSVFGSFTE
jgi:hypothetical protein